MVISNKHIVITGAASGIGKELVLELAGSGNKILAIDINQEGLEILSNKSSQIHTLTLDLTKKDSVSAIFDWIQLNWKTVDYFFANAGFAKFGPWEDTDQDTFAKMLQINVLSPIETAKILKQTQAHYSCRLVVTASAMSYWPVPGYAAYAATKAALHHFVETLRSEGDGDWITLVYPGATETDFFKNAGKEIPKAFPVQTVQTVARHILQGVSKGKKKIYPSRLFQATMLIDRILPVFKPLYFLLERKKLRKWIDDKNGG
ncbi:SDR family NAD(P)-dependent oxidoreductase [Aquiflexum gelatinilyticum]|uniref:SDR family NAD(P)-dependent oxidoreductase n=1 Tax=Aquiflexum gelatinilyticum TaxID=2961943 RepID=UPI002168D8E6|nr:SDR family NAD(P)-dependent oxidoreductase [Aquiflexum gelatinilyticum]MCS4434982.1 SDR family NAD(P)-dependent oxidoreductase [Aquiflexum gelatinilyticum]